jgi:hypothetical protein
MRGDIHVLKRIQKQTRRQDAACAKIKRKLKQTDGEPAYANREAFVAAFNTQVNLLRPHRGVSRARRRLRRARTLDGRRMFYVSEFGGCLDHGGVGVVVAPACNEATEKLALDTVLKCERTPNCALFTKAVRLLKSKTVPQIFQKANSDVVCTVVKVGDDATLFFLCGHSPGLHSVQSADSFGLDEESFHSLQSTALNLLGLVEEK